MKKNNTSKKKLGIYLDIDSVNWSLVTSETNELIDMGVYAFTAGCENFGMGKREVSKMLGRRMIRLRRIRYARVRTRKYHLLKELIAHKMCPLCLESLERWKKTKFFPEEELREWLAMNPYKLREKGIKEMLSIEEIGRVLYQVSRHRGYNVKQRNSRLIDSVLAKGIPAERKIGYLKTQQSIRNKKTLGQYLEGLLPPDKVSYATPKERIRNRICITQMYFQELHKIWEFQSRFNHRLTDKIRNKLMGTPGDFDPKGLLFFKRPLKSMKHKVGKCMFEKNKPRCSVSSLQYQALEGWKWVNTIRVNSKPLTSSDAAKVYHYYATHYRFSFLEIKELLGMATSRNFNYKDEQSFTGSFINSEMSKRKFFGSRWFQMEEKEKEDIYHSLSFFTSTERLASCAENKWGLSASSAKQFSSLRLDKNYAPVSRKACVKILYFLKRGYPYKQAVFLAGVKNAIGADNWNSLDQTQQQELSLLLLNTYRESSSSKIIKDLERLIFEIAGLQQFNPKKLYGFSQSHKENRKTSFLPKDKRGDEEIKQLKNPLLIHSAFKMRKVINAVIKEYGGVSEIACELSVHLKTNRMQRFMHKIGKKKKQTNYQFYQARLSDLGENVLPKNLLKYDLWKESSQTCPYSGKEIPLELLFTSHIEVVYIHPWSRSLNDTILNKTLCVAEVAEQLEERTPYEFFQTEAPEDWEEVKKRASKLFSNTTSHPTNFRKYIRFIKKYNYRDVVKKQFNDPHQLSKNVAEILGQVCDKVSMIPGIISEDLIDEWMLVNTFKEKNLQYDYRVNALRAYVNAVNTKEHVLALARLNKYKRNVQLQKVPIPNSHFLEQIEKKINSLLIAVQNTHRIVSKRRLRSGTSNQRLTSNVKSIRGSLHKDTLYGKRTPPLLNEGLHIRKPLTVIKTTSQLAKIVDPKIKAIISKKIQWDGKEKSAVPLDQLMEYDHEGAPVPQIFLPNKKGNKVPVYKVRMRENFSSPVQLKKHLNGYVVPRNNHHILIYKTNENEYQEEVTTFWEVIKRSKRGDQTYRSISSKEGTVVTHLHINDLFLLGLNEEQADLHLLPEFVLRKHLYRVQKLSSKYYEFRIAYRKFNTSCDYPEYIRINNFGNKKTGWKTYNPIKVKITLTGKLEIM